MISFRTSPTNYPPETKYKTASRRDLIRGECFKEVGQKYYKWQTCWKMHHFLQTRIMSPKKQKIINSLGKLGHSRTVSGDGSAPYRKQTIGTFVLRSPMCSWHSTHKWAIRIFTRNSLRTTWKSSSSSFFHFLPSGASVKIRSECAHPSPFSCECNCELCESLRHVHCQNQAAKLIT